MSLVVVAGNSADFERRVRLAVGGDNVRALTPAAAQDPTRLMVELAAGEMPDVVLLGAGVETDVAFASAAHVDESHPGTAVILVGALGGQVWREAMRAGIRDVIDPELEVAELRDLLELAAAGASARRTAASPDAGRPRGRVIPVVSPKGGCGKTTVATNLAVGLGKLAPDQTVIVDLDLQFGDVASGLQLAPDQGIEHAVRVPGLDAMGLKTFLTPHSTGVYALCAPDSPAAVDAITDDDVARLIDLLASEFRYVVVDTAPGLTEHTLAVLDKATDAVMVCAMDVPSVRGLYKELDVLAELGMSRLTRHMLLNFADRHNGLTVKDVETVIGTSIDIVLPRSKAVPLSTNRGIPLLQSGGRDPVARKLQELVARFQPQLATVTRRGPRHRALSR